MWYWNPVDCNEALPGVHDLKACVKIMDDNHPFKTDEIPEGKIWGSDASGLPVLLDLPEPTQAEIIAAAEATRESLIIEAKETISLWQTELQLGIISDENKTSLIAWVQYIQALNAVDTSTAPDIEWPVKPE
jgi:hypothetical protein